MAHGGVNLIRRKEILLEESLQQDAAHLARAKKGNAHMRQLRGYFGGLNGYLCHLSISPHRDP
jgi:hypothetical protein